MMVCPTRAFTYAGREMISCSAVRWFMGEILSPLQDSTNSLHIRRLSAICYYRTIRFETASHRYRDVQRLQSPCCGARLASLTFSLHSFFSLWRKGEIERGWKTILIAYFSLLPSLLPGKERTLKSLTPSMETIVITEKWYGIH
jgi:hypothetical protein